jgi:hypothetical protein
MDLGRRMWDLGAEIRNVTQEERLCPDDDSDIWIESVHSYAFSSIQLN